MAALVGNLTSVWNPLDWTLLFARQPEPDLEFTEEELEQTTSTRATGPLNPRKKSGGGRPILWMLLLIIFGGIAYVATMEPEMLAEWLSPYLGESTPPVAMNPTPLPQAPAPQGTPGPSDAAPAPAPPADAASTAAAPTAPAMTPPQVAAKPTVPTAPPAAPMFGEGQRVTVMADPNTPGENIPLYADSAGSKPGPFVRAGITLTVMDGDLQPSGWMYAVRTDEGAKGWVPEKRLRLKF